MSPSEKLAAAAESLDERADAHASLTAELLRALVPYAAHRTPVKTQPGSILACGLDLADQILGGAS